MYENIVIEQTNIAATSNFATNLKSDDVHFFGEDTVAEAIVVPEEMRGKIPGDYGREKGVAWLTNLVEKAASFFSFYQLSPA